MATGDTARADRIELRVTKEEKRLLAAAAAYERLDVTSFIMRNVLPAAREVVEHAERIVPSARDSARILKLLENPPKPTPALLSAARRRSQKK
ncbi:MAG: type II toxin-antitoxin system TacA family antitoxin [Acidiferrobacterales bacterium]